MSKIMITGCAGFIGSNLTDRLVELGYEVIGIDNLSTGFRKNINPNIDYKENSDIRDKELWKYMEGVDTIFHTAALARIQPSIIEPVEFHDVNVNGTFNLINLAVRSGVRKIVFSASSSVYGNQEVMPEVETMTPNPMNPYAVQKLIGELYMKTWANCYPINTVSLRYFNVYGPRQTTKGAYATVVGIFLKQKQESQDMTITGGGEKRRDFTWVGDVVNANILAMDCDKLNKGEVVNIGTGKNYSINEVANLIGGKRKYIAPRPFEAKETRADITKAIEILNWRPEVTLEEGIERLKNV